jgi:hypothetical protein
MVFKDFNICVVGQVWTWKKRRENSIKTMSLLRCIGLNTSEYISTTSTAFKIYPEWLKNSWNLRILCIPNSTQIKRREKKKRKFKQNNVPFEMYWVKYVRIHLHNIHCIQDLFWMVEKFVKFDNFMYNSTQIKERDQSTVLPIKYPLLNNYPFFYKHST